MALNETKKEFQRKLKDGIDQAEYSRRVRQNILRRKLRKTQELTDDTKMEERDDEQK